jgi:hypothetical protein
VSFVLSGLLWLKVQDLENKMAPTEGGADSLQDLEDKIKELEIVITGLETDTDSNVTNILNEITLIRNNLTTLDSDLASISASLSALISRLDALESFLEHHVIEVFIEGIRPFTPDCTVAQNPCTIYFDVTINGTLYTVSSPTDIQRDTPTDKVWINQTITYKNPELGKKIPIDFGIRWVGGGSSVLDIDNSSDSTLVSIIYDVVGETWTGDDPEMDGFTTGVSDGIAEDDAEFWFDIRTL